MQPIFDQRRYLIPFRLTLLPQIFTDTLVIGGGVAGLRAAVAAAEHGEVIVLSKAALAQTNTAWAQGGVAAVLREDDDVDTHVLDTMTAGAGLCDEGAVRRVCEEGPARVRELFDWGMAVDRDASGEPHAGREGGHSASRIYHSGGDATGLEIERVLERRVRANPAMRVFDGCFALDLLTPGDEPGSPVLGAITHHPKFGLQVVWARSTILASGGAGVLYRETTNPYPATADGLAMAYRAGATLADMAFMQFHPTVLYLPGAPRSLISEAVRGEGAHLVDDSGHRFMTEVHELAELAPRDIVSKAIVAQIAAHGGRVWLDATHVDGFAKRFPGITENLAQYELDPTRDRIPVHPAAHYFIGGVRTDGHGRTDVPGLWAVGESASTGLHGANRLASNSLLEGLVLGEGAGRDAGRSSNGNGRPGPVPIVSDIPISQQGELDLSDVRSSVRSAMWRNVGVTRTGAKLAGVREMLDIWARYTLDKILDEPEGWETQNMLLVGALVARSAEWREESRGCHRRDDIGETKEAFGVHDLWRRGKPEPVLVPVEQGAPV